MIAHTDQERKSLREGGALLAQILKDVSKMVAPGIETRELDAFCEKLIRDAGATPALIGYQPYGAKRPYPSTVCISLNDEVVHGIPTENSVVIKEADLVKLDTVLEYQGIFVDAAVTVCAGTVSDEDASLVDSTRTALMKGIEAARIGKHIGDISAAIEAHGVESGLGIVYELGGHGVGGAVHEAPYVPNVGDAGDGPELVDGMVLAIEPMFTLGTPKVKLLSDGYTYVTRDGSRSAHFEHTILITKNGTEILTRA